MKPGTISNYENEKSRPTHDDTVRLADFFGLPVEMLIRENLEKKFVTWQEVEDWKLQQELAKKRGEQHLAAVAQAPVLLNALVEHYVKTVSDLTGAQPNSIRKEIEQLFHARLKEVQGAAQGK